MAKPQTVYLIDGSAQVHRAYFAIKGLTTTRGLPTNATYGFTTMLRKLYQDEKPEWIGLSFDLPGPTFRHEAYTEYKAHRRPMDEALSVQMPFVRRVCAAFHLPILELAGYEADDVLATLSVQAVAQGFRVVIVSGDKDLLQLVNDDIHVLNPGREGSGATLYDPKGVEEKFGVPPDRVVDVLALVGDAVDNVPGVPGIGEKGARELVREYGSLEGVLDHAEAVKRKAYREGLLAHKEDALLSKRLVTLDRAVPVTFSPEALRTQEPDRRACHGLFTELEFVALAREYAPEAVEMSTSHRLADGEGLEAVIEAARRHGRAGWAWVASQRDPMRADLLGVAVCATVGEAVYLPLDASPAAIEELRALVEDPKVAFLSGNAKRDHTLLARQGITIGQVGFDAIVASYLLNPGRRSHSLADLALEQLGEKLVPVEEVLRSSASGQQSTIGGLLAQAAAQEADLALRLSETLGARLETEGLTPVFRDLELPLISVLADIERAGVKVDRPLLEEMARDMDAQINRLTEEIHVLAGGEINIHSPIQLREVLFGRLGLKSGKKTAKTRAASTAEDVLEDLAEEHPLPRKILEFRGLTKLKSTYVDALPTMIHPGTGRIHASFHQTVAATGRISSSDPNLQNIPIRTADGRRIRSAFVAEPGHLLLSADYSQIELRILAHLSKDPTLIDTFRRGEDIHDRTSREVFGPLSALSADEQRRRSKMINYALLYGKTAFTLAKDLDVPQKEAQAFIEAYFARYPSVRRFIEDTIAAAREAGMVRTLLGRLRRLPDLKSRNFPVRAEAERQAINTPVQGSAADLIKKAMIDIDHALRGSGARMVMQIHDELVLEVPEAEAEDVRRLVQDKMEHALELEVPLVAEARLGRHWGEAHS